MAALNVLKTARRLQDRTMEALPALLGMCAVPELRRMRADYDRNRALLVARSDSRLVASEYGNVYGLAWSRDRCVAAIRRALDCGAVDYDEYENALRREVDDDDELYYSGLLDVSRELGCHYVGVQPRDDYESVVRHVARIAKTHLRSDGGWRYVSFDEIERMLNELESDPSTLCITENSISFHKDKRHDFLLVRGNQATLADGLDHDDFVKEERWLNPYFFTGSHDDELHITIAKSSTLRVAELPGDAAKILYLVVRQAFDSGGCHLTIRTRVLEEQAGVSGQAFTIALAELFEKGWIYDAIN
ncbi:hypothetical protein [Paraburkholderia sediminicola]|uniref:hypothetical protein n=1 Tax=Paraburkholderia sediminicola TaxID=458836 RepID=UPI0038B6CCC9